MASWREENIVTNEGKAYKVHIAPDWNTSYFISRFKNAAMAKILSVLQEIKDRKPERIDWKITANEIWVYNNVSSYEMFHAPKENIVNDVVFERLRNGKPEPREWSTGQKATVEVWST